MLIVKEELKKKEPLRLIFKNEIIWGIPVVYYWNYLGSKKGKYYYYENPQMSFDIKKRITNRLIVDNNGKFFGTIFGFHYKLSQKKYMEIYHGVMIDFERSELEE